MSLPMSAARAVTEVIARCESAKETGLLDLSNCSLMYIADAVYLKLRDYNITKLSVSNNSLKKFPKKFVTKFPDAIIFNIGNNQLTEFPEELGEWTSMKGLSAANNLLETWPEGVYNMPELGLLDLSGNKIKEFDVVRLFSSCPLLKQVHLAGNPLEDDCIKLLNERKPDGLILKLT